jgi:transcriptional regulator with XRE-family HTH domain
MSIGTTLRLLTKATGTSVADLATAIPRAGINTVNAWLKDEKMPGRDQIDAIARTFGVPAGALLSELASTLDPARTKGEHQLLAAYRALNERQQSAVLEVVRSMVATTPAAEALAIDPTPRKRAYKKTARKTAATSTRKPAARKRTKQD